MIDAWLSLLGSVAIALAGVAGAWFAGRSARQQAVATSAQAPAAQADSTRLLSYDQLQEDLSNLGERFDRYVLQAEKDRRYQSGLVRHLDDEVNELRATMTAAGLTPPPRKPWPPYPGEPA